LDMIQYQNFVTTSDAMLSYINSVTSINIKSFISPSRQ
jgi:hypothetical protein